MTDPDELLAGLDREQREVARALHGPVCVLAGAGTGKTRAITHRIAYGVATGAFQANQLLAVTFTARAAGEMRGRLRGLGAGTVQARTFHSAALRQLQYFWPQTVGGPPPRILESKISLVAEAAAACRIKTDRAALRDLASEIEWCKSTQTAPEDYGTAVAKAQKVPPREPAEVSRVYAAYEEHKRDRGFIDFEDVLLLTIGVLESKPNVADQVRSQYRHFVVDEYQDVNPLQQRLLDQWLGQRDSLCVVGDASQTIYSFTGATPEYLLGFPDRYPDATVIRLVRDYRSTPQVVGVANALLGAIPQDTQAGRRAARARLELVAQRHAGPPAGYTEYPDEAAEAEGVAENIRTLIERGARPAEIAVLFRINAQSEVYEQALADRGVPYVVRGIERFFDRPEVRQAVLLLRGAARSSGAAEGGSAGSAAGDSAGGDGSMEGLAATVRAVLSGNGWSPKAPAGSGRAREQWESLAALAALAEEHEAGHPRAGLVEFVRELEERAAVQHAPVVDGVTLASLHSAKGLEWDAVYLVGLTEGLMPITYAETDEQLEEERRLLYVGVTRARETLQLSWALARAPGGRASRRPSRFLDSLREAKAAMADAGAGGVVRRGSGRGPQEQGKSKRTGPVRCRVCGKALIEAVDRKLGRCADCPSDLDQALFERLREWRLAQATDQSVPAYVVFTDATLTAIAETRPTERSALARIPGVGAGKLERYADQVLAILTGSAPAADEAAADSQEPPDAQEPPESQWPEEPAEAAEASEPGEMLEPLPEPEPGDVGEPA
ncbi:ATP-dependent DNA helicase UvrD2 [Actinospica sp.]|uniref:ATP-dependent DNA helicase UvrD2 n=1 Tax=Actinospica sp. TaxID=1872142 RepID=UPI002B7D638F|nr:ATP-dependent DNA helicase UvrD2 [Actinospica sp.]HWG24720.1 ATP-dependent DNA helicase UvrD2 [Actinospica sp.]